MIVGAWMRQRNRGASAEIPGGGPESRLWAAVVGRGQEARMARPDEEQHSCRVGAAQDLLALNIDMASVMQAG